MILSDFSVGPIAVAEATFRSLVQAFLAPAPTVVLPTPRLAVDACLSTSILSALDGDDDFWGARVPPTAGSGDSDAPVAVTFFPFLMSISIF